MEALHPYKLSKDIILFPAGSIAKRFGALSPSPIEIVRNVTCPPTPNCLEKNDALAKMHMNSHTVLLVTTTTPLSSSKNVKKESPSYA